jgi:hypothetical protein
MYLLFPCSRGISSVFPNCFRGLQFIQILLIMLYYLSGAIPLKAQTCSEATLFQKYWQYKKTYEKHFIVQDRDPVFGCINDGIGFSQASGTTSSCNFEKQGYGLPATHHVISPVGWGMPGAEINERFGNDHPLKDVDCGGTLSYGDEPPGTPRKHNFIDFGSETLTQLGWHFVTLATEYELLGRSGQVEQQKKVLEEIFLGLQAIRRLDMQAQCMLKEMYDTRNQGQLICDKPYTTTKWGDKNPFNSPPCHKNFDAKINTDCNYTPDMSGYSGFMIRSDAPQGLDELLHDPTDETWHVDAVGGSFGGLNNDPTDNCDDVDPFCFMASTQHFLSHDQIINLLYGLSFIKRYIPENVEVTLCDGTKHKVLEMAQKTSHGIVGSIAADPELHITIPGSRACCNKVAKLSICEGGWTVTTAYGLIKTDEYIQEGSLSPLQTIGNVGTQLAFEGLGANFKNGRDFYLKQSCNFKDLSEVSNLNQSKIVDMADKANKEILLLGNDLLFPGGESMAEKIGGKEYFMGLLCDAPCSGPCMKPDDYGTNPWQAGNWPEGFECPNTPGWKGNRWDGTGTDPQAPDSPVRGQSRKGNGLDYMALFNMYMLQYGTSGFYNPNDPEKSPNLSLQNTNGILGPSVLCVGETGNYILDNYNSSLMSDIQWNSSANIGLTNTVPVGTNAKFNVNVPTSGSVSVEYQTTKLMLQNYNLSSFSLVKDPDDPTNWIQVPHDLFTDNCANQDVKPIIQEGSQFEIKLTLEPCSWNYIATALQTGGFPSDHYTYKWKVTCENETITGTGPFIDFYELVITHRSGQYTIELEVNGKCTVFKSSKTIDIEACGNGGGGIESIIRVNPNPAQEWISVSLIRTDSQQLDEIPTSGYPLNIRRVNGGSNLINTKLSNNGQNINVGSLPNGYYNIYLNTGNIQPLSTTFVIAR